MNYLIIYNDAAGTLDKKDFHEKITKYLSVTDWWHYISNVYIITTPVPSAGITNSLARWFPGLLFLIIEVSFNDASGVLPKEAFDWIRNKSGKFVKIKETSLPKIKLPLRSLAGGASGSATLQSILELGASIKTRPKSWTMEDFFKNTLPDIK